MNCIYIIYEQIEFDDGSVSTHNLVAYEDKSAAERHLEHLREDSEVLHATYGIDQISFIPRKVN